MPQRSPLSQKANDHSGHAAGTRPLKTMAGSISDCVRTTDVLARHSGDECVMLMPHSRSKTARIAAGRIRAAIHKTSFEVKGQRIDASVGISIASYAEGVESARDVLEEAGVALYRSEQSGRDRVTVYCRDLEIVNHLPIDDAPAISRPISLSSADS